VCSNSVPKTVRPQVLISETPPPAKEFHPHSLDGLSLVGSASVRGVVFVFVEEFPDRDDQLVVSVDDPCYTFQSLLT
jgi:hypothetical protein